MDREVLHAQNLEGTYTALATPFNKDASEIDFASLKKLIAFQLEAKVDGIVLCGSTAEASTMTDEEYKSIIENAAPEIHEHTYVVAGIGTSSTKKACEMAEYLSTKKVDAILVVTPPYNKPLQTGIELHFQEIKKHSKLPLIAYNIPGRTGTNILSGTLDRLAKEDVIIGVKDSTGSLDGVIELYAANQNISILSGEDSLVHSIMATGGSGTISASANVAPAEFKAMTDAALRGDFRKSLDLQAQLLPLVRAMFIETNPIPVKAALALLGIIDNNSVRLPLTVASENVLCVLQKVIKR